MTAGDAPMLSQPGDADNLPMISGHGTKIIADARGAYLAGNLKAVLAQMTDAQGLRFRQMMVQHLLDRVVELGELDEGFPIHQAIEIARSWLINPAPSSADHMRRILEEAQEIRAVELRADSSLRYVYSALTIAAELPIAIIYVIQAAQLEDAARPIEQLYRIHSSGARRPEDLTNEPNEPYVWLAKRWQIEVAWAIIRGQETPSFFDLDQGGPQRAYLMGHLESLIRLLNPAQRLRYRQALMRQLFRHVDGIVPDEPIYEVEHRIIEASHRWLEEPSETHAHQIAAELNRLGNEDNTASGLRGMVSALEVVRNETGNQVQKLAGVQGAIFSLGTVAVSPLILASFGVRWAIEQAAWVRHRRTHNTALREASRWWQVEAAWAVLHDRDLPPLEYSG